MRLTVSFIYPTSYDLALNGSFKAFDFSGWGLPLMQLGGAQWGYTSSIFCLWDWLIMGELKPNTESY